MKVIVSIIVPVYNAASTIEKLVQSVFDQTYTNWELLLIENGSTDDTSNICAHLAAKEPRIRLLHSEKGVSRARNLGIKQAQGEWIFFADADDWLLPEALELLLQPVEMTPDVDIIMGGAEKGRHKLFLTNSPKENLLGTMQIEKLLCRFLSDATRYLTVWGKLFSTIKVHQCEVLFDEQLTHAEDSDFCLRFLLTCQRVIILRSCVYHYSLNESSTVRSFDSDFPNKYIQSINITKKYLNVVSYSIKEPFAGYIITHLLVCFVHGVCHQRNPETWRQQLKRIRNLIEQPIFAEAIVNANAPCLPIQQQVMLFFLRKKYCIIVYWLIKIRQLFVRISSR